MLRTPNPNVVYRPSFFFQLSRRVLRTGNGKMNMNMSEEKWSAQVAVQRMSWLLVPQNVKLKLALVCNLVLSKSAGACSYLVAPLCGRQLRKTSTIDVTYDNPE